MHTFAEIFTDTKQTLCRVSYRKDLFPLRKCDDDRRSGTGSRPFYISSWAMCWRLAHWPPQEARDMMGRVCTKSAKSAKPASVTFDAHTLCDEQVVNACILCADLKYANQRFGCIVVYVWVPWHPRLWYFRTVRWPVKSGGLPWFECLGRLAAPMAGLPKRVVWDFVFHARMYTQCRLHAHWTQTLQIHTLRRIYAHLVSDSTWLHADCLHTKNQIQSIYALCLYMHTWCRKMSRVQTSSTRKNVG